jgi:phosphoglycerate dehydrogenase-like enzyme
MNNNNLVIWCNDDFRSDQSEQLKLLTEGVGKHQLLRFDRDQDGHDGEAQAALELADVAYGFPNARAVVECEHVRWVHLNAAGYTSFDHQEIKDAFESRGAMLTNSSAVYDEPCAQHLLGMIVTLARELPAAHDSQRSDRSWPMIKLRSTARLLNDQTALILGFGSIARRLVELLRPLGMKLVAVRRNVTGDESIQVIETSRVDEFLPHADHVVNILPANEQTKNFLNADRLKLVKPGTIVYNIGRGVTLDQVALIEELRSGRVAAAYLDVTDPEPLPPDDPLWTTPNCLITPHTGGGHATEKERQVLHFLDNLRRFEQGEPLRNRVF